MQLTVKGQHLDVGDSLREHVRAQLTQTAEKYFRDPIEATVIFTKEKNRFSVQISMHMGKGIILEAHSEDTEPYATFDKAAERVGTRLRRYKDKLKDHHRKEDPIEMHMAAYKTFGANENEAEPQEPAIIAEMETQIPTLAVADAVMRLELGNMPAMMFKNFKTGQYNMIYRRKDGNIGWIDPAQQKKKES